MRSHRENAVHGCPNLSIFLPKSGSGKVMWRALQEQEND